jgi:hypothetical protein
MSADGSAELHEKSDEVRCKRCNAVTRLAHKILNVRTGGSLQMYRCPCGAQVWVE